MEFKILGGKKEYFEYKILWNETVKINFNI